jgi:hypothetical protein
MAGNLGVHADVVKRACRYRRDDIACVSAGSGGVTVIAALTGRNRTDNEPDQDDKPSDSHIYLRKTGGSCASEEPQTRDNRSSTLSTADTRKSGLGSSGKFHLSRHKDHPGDRFTPPVYRVC